MAECKCYEIRSRLVNYCPGTAVVEDYGVCLGTKECECCSCDGDTNKCNFYEDIRKEDKKMDTAEMWLIAQENGKTYGFNELRYNRDKGFFDTSGNPWENLAEDETISSFMAYDDWDEVNDIMTKSEAEEKFGIMIIGE